VFDGDPALPKKGRSPQFSAHVYCGQTAAWIKMTLGTDRVGVRWGPSSPSLVTLSTYRRYTNNCIYLSIKGHSPPNFRPMSVVAKQLDGLRCWMKTPLGTEVDLSPVHTVLDGVPALRKRGTAAPPSFFDPCLLWPRSPISATAELLQRKL